MERHSKAAERARRYRERLKQRLIQGGAAFERRVAEIQKLARPDVPLDLLHDYARIGLALDDELARTPRRTRAVQELSAAKLALGRELGITPKERRLAGEKDADSIGQALARSAANVERLRAREWLDLREEVRIFGGKIIGEKAIFEEDLVMRIGDLRRRRPGLFTSEELAANSRELFDAIMADAPARTSLPAPPPDEGEELIF